mgnify:CR=1 FL=1
MNKILIRYNTNRNNTPKIDKFVFIIYTLFAFVKINRLTLFDKFRIKKEN